MIKDEKQQLRQARSKEFIDLFERILDRDDVDRGTPRVSILFEMIADKLLSECDFVSDGVTSLSAHVRKPRQVDFTGTMWVIGNGPDRKEQLEMRVTDKRMTKQGIALRLRLGEEEKVGTLDEAFGLTHE